MICGRYEFIARSERKNSFKSIGNPVEVFLLVFLCIHYIYSEPFISCRGEFHTRGELESEIGKFKLSEYSSTPVREMCPIINIYILLLSFCKLYLQNHRLRNWNQIMHSTSDTRRLQANGLFSEKVEAKKVDNYVSMPNCKYNKPDLNMQQTYCIWHSHTWFLGIFSFLGKDLGRRQRLIQSVNIGFYCCIWKKNRLFCRNFLKHYNHRIYISVQCKSLKWKKAKERETPKWRENGKT